MTAARISDEIRILGTPVSPGIAIGQAHVETRGMNAPDVYAITESEIPSEIARFSEALDQTRRQIDEIQQHIGKISGESEGRIFDAHLLFLEDRAILKRVQDGVAKRLQNVEFVFYAIIETYLEAMRRISDPYLRERTADIEDIYVRVMGNLDRSSTKPHTLPEHQYILFSYDLAPSDTAMMDPKQVLGFCTELGSAISHTAILARSLGIPAIVGLDRAILEVTQQQTVILDGYRGLLILSPSDETLAEYRKLREEKEDAYQALNEDAPALTATQDEHRVVLSANLEFTHELEGIKAVHSEGIGLFRTEFFLLDSDDFPSELSQQGTYEKAIIASGKHLTIIRTLDAGGDKLSAEALTEPEPNPFLGWRGIRVSLARKDLFKTQLRGILRASVIGKTGVMFPMISGLSELRAARAILDECKRELEAECIPFDPEIQVGIMIEVPSAAILARELAQEVDFFSIGTNDLTQYTVAVDRINHRVANLFRTTNPAVVRLMHQTVEASQEAGIWTGICGEMAGDIRVTPLLVGMGTTELSVGAHQLPIVRKAIRSLNFSDCQELTKAALKCKFSQDILDLCREMTSKAYPDLFFEATDHAQH